MRSVRLLEREGSLAALREYAKDARRGEGRLVLLAGEAGVGKTAVLEQLESELAADRWLWGACDGLFTPRPLGPLFDVAGRVGGDLLAACRAAAPRETLFGSLLDHLSASPALTVLVIEDVHWADEATLDLLRFLGRRLRQAPALVAVTYRDDGLRPLDPLRVVLGELASHRSTRRVDLGPLSERAVEELAIGSAVPAAELYRLSGGNPFYATQLLGTVAVPAPRGTEPGVARLPGSARDAVLARVAGLDATARTVLDAAALTGSRAERSLLAAAVPGMNGSIDACVASGIVTQDAGGLRFRHELARQAIAEAVPAHQAAQLHAALLSALRAAGAEGDDARLAYHAEGANDPEAVLVHAPRAARRASELASHREACAQYERALRFAAQEPTIVLAGLLDGFAREASFVDRCDEAAEACERALQLWRAEGDRLRESDTLRQLSRAYWRLCRGADSTAAAEAALAVLDDVEPCRELAWAYAGLAATCVINGHNERAVGLARTAQGIAEQLGLADVLSDALNTEGVAHAATVTVESPAALRRSLAVALAAGLEEQAGRAYANLLHMAAGNLRLEEATTWFAQGITYCDDHDLSSYGSCMRGTYSYVLSVLGRWEEATAVGQEVLDRTRPSLINRVESLQTLGLLRARRGERDAWSFLDVLEDFVAGGEAGPWIACAQLARTEAAWLDGQPTQAVAELERMIDVIPTLDGHDQGRLAVWAARLGVEVDVPGPVPVPFATELAGRHRAAATEWTRIGAPYEAAMALLGSTHEAELREALATFDALGAAAPARICRRRLRELGASNVPVGPQATTRSHAVGLTRRQQEVLELVVAGLANAEISGRLFISERTVDHHVSALLGKMGVASRTAAAAEALRLGLVQAPPAPEAVGK
jgi:DNA-binding CsgD family transcriptional regulator